MAKSKIIKDLANGTVDTITALKRAKVLVSDLNNWEILKWLNYEISGYPEDVAVPTYRKFRGNLVGSYFKGSMDRHMVWKNVSIPLGKMPSNMQESLLSIELHEGIESLRKLEQSSQNSDKQISKLISADFFPWLAKYNNDPYMMITSARVIFGEHIIGNIFSIVENKLLDILILLEQEFGSLDELDIDVTTKSNEEIENINNKILVLIYKDNSIAIGDGNKIKGTTIASEIN